MQILGKFLFSLLLLVGAACWFPLHAGHIAGGNISYECLGDNEYRITLSVFRDCSESSLGATQGIKFNSGCGDFFSIPAIQVFTGEVSQLCPTALANSACSGGIWPGMEIFRYELVVTLNPCQSWQIYWENCIRTTSNNVDDTLFPCYRIDAYLNNVEAPCNNSPVVTQQAVPYVCLNQPVNYNPGVIESDGDSLRYYLVPGLTFGGGPISYEPGFSGLLPIPGATINNNTGQVSFTPPTTGKYTVVIEVEEYNSEGVLIGTIRHDILFVVENCPQPPPQPDDGGFTSITGAALLTSGDVIEACGGDSFCATISFSSVNPTTEVFLSSNIDIALPGATMTITGTNPAVAEICWTPPSGFSNSVQVNINVQDDACPIFGISNWSFVVTPIISVNGGPDQIICSGDAVQLEANGDTQYLWDVFSGDPIVPGDNFTCTDCPNPIASPSQTTVYLVTGLTSTVGCVSTDTVVVAVALQGVSALVSSESCFLNDATISLDIPYGSGNYSYLWETGETTPFLFNIPAGDYGIFIEDLDLGCSIDTVVNVAFPPFPPTNAGPDVFFCGTVFQMQAESNAIIGFWEAPEDADATFFPDIYTHDAEVVISSSGSWDFIWYEDNGSNCTNQDTVTITVTVPPNIEAGIDDSVCGLIYELEAEITPIGEPFWTGPPGAIFEPDEFDPNATVTVPDYGLHYLSWNLDLGFECGGIDSIAVFFAEPLVAEAGPSDSVCGLSYLLQPTPGGNTGYWTLNSGNLSLEPGTNPGDTIVTATSYGTYELIWTIQDNYCIDSDTLQITFIEQPVADAGEDDAVCGLTYTLNAQASVGNGQWIGPPGAVFSPDPTQPNAEVTVADYGTHEFIWTENNSFTCQDADTVSVLFVEIPTAEAGPDLTTCGLTYDLSTPGMGALLGIGTGSWSAGPEVIFADTLDPNTVVTVSTEGTYTLTWTQDNGNGCVSEDTREITFWNIPLPDVGDDFEVCGLQATLDGQLNVGSSEWSIPGGAVFNPDAQSLNTEVTVAAFGIYTFTLAADNNGCEASDSLQVTFIEPPVANAGIDEAVCGLEFNLAAQPSVGFGEWSADTDYLFSDQTSPNTIVQTTNYGAAVFTWTENNGGCVDSAEVEITFVEQPVADPGINQIICGLEAILSANPSVGSGLWYTNSAATIDNQTGGSAEVTAPGPGEIEFWWVENNGSGCADSASVSIEFIMMPQPNAGGNDSICGLAGSVTAIPSVGAGSWSANPPLSFDNSNAPQTDVAAPDYGSYTLTWTEDNGNGCVDTDQIVLVFYELPTPNAGEDAVVCGLTASLNAQASSGTGEWSAPGLTFSDINDPQAEVTATDYGAYTLTWTELFGACTVTAEVELNFLELPSADAGLDAETCGLTIELQATDVTGNGVWQLPDGISSSDSNDPLAQITADDYGDYTLYWVESNFICQDSAAVIISFSEPPVVNAGSDEAVCGLTYVLQASTNVGSGSWVAQPGLAFSDENDPNAEVTAAAYGSYTLTWQAVNGASCSDSDEVEITFVEAPTANAGVDFEVCGLTADLAAIPSGGTGSWSGPAEVIFSDANAPDSEITATTFGVYTLTWTESTGVGCNAIDQVEVTFLEQPVANPGNDQNVCGLSATLEAQPSVGNGVWSAIPDDIEFLPSADDPNAMANVNTEGTYVLIWTETNGICTDQDEIEVVFTDQPSANAGVDDSVCGLTYQLSANAVDGSWTGPAGAIFNPSPNDPNASVSVDDYGSYTFVWTVETAGICSDSDEVTIDFFGTPTTSPVSVNCIDGNLNYTVTFTISGGDADSYSVTGGPGSLTGNTFVSDPIPNGATYNFQVSDANECQTITVSGSNVCPNLTYAGTMNLTPLNICGDGPASATHNNNNTLDGDDALIFILHSNPSLPLGTVWAQGSDPQFSFVLGMEYGETYYISAVVGNSDGSGGVDFTDPLLSVSQGTPVTFYQIPQAIVSGGGTACLGDTLWATVQFSGSSPYQFTYAINGSVQAPIETDDAEIQIPLTNSGQLQPMQLTNEYCLGEIEGLVNVQFAPLPEAEIFGGGTVCFGESETVTIEMSGMAPFEVVYAIDADPQPPVLTDDNSYSITTSEAGLYTLIYVEDQMCIGETSGEAELEVIPEPVANPGPDIDVCFDGESVILGDNPQPGYTYTWSNGQFLSNANTANPELVYTNDIFVPVTLNFNLTVTVGGCSSSEEVEVVLYPVPEIETNNAVSMCEGGAAQLQVTGATEVTWSPNDYISDANANFAWVYPPEDMTYSASVSNQYGCTASGEVLVVVNPMPEVQFTATSDSVCAPSVVVLQNQTAPEFLGSCLWNISNGQVISSCNPNVYGYFLENGNYDVSLTVTTPQGCAFTLTEQNFVNIVGPEAYFTYQPNPVDVKNTRIQFNNQTNGAVSYIWDFGDLGSTMSANPSVDFPHQVPDNYEVCLTAIDSEGCMDEYCTVIEIEADVLVYVPNAFSPNGDGINDLFFPVMEGVDIVEYEMMIFNRRGKLVWHTNDPDAKWSGADLTGEYYDDNQIYTWTLRIKDQYSTIRENLHGTVMVVR